MYVCVAYLHDRELEMRRFQSAKVYNFFAEHHFEDFLLNLHNFTVASQEKSRTAHSLFHNSGTFNSCSNTYGPIVLFILTTQR